MPRPHIEGRHTRTIAMDDDDIDAASELARAWGRRPGLPRFLNYADVVRFALSRLLAEYAPGRRIICPPIGVRRVIEIRRGFATPDGFLDALPPERVAS